MTPSGGIGIAASVQKEGLCATLAATVLIVLAAVPTVAYQAASPPVFEETWEEGLDAWTVQGEGAAQDCAVGYTGCSLVMAPPCCGAPVTVARNLSIPLDGLTSLSYAFLHNTSARDTDTRLTVRFANGGSLLLSPTDFWGSNDGVTLDSPGLGAQREFTYLGNRTAWHTLTLYVHPADAVAWAEVTREDGTEVGTSPPVPIPAHPEIMTSIALETVNWWGFHGALHYDSLQARPATYLQPLPPANLRADARDGALVLLWDAAYSPTASPVVAHKVYRVDSGEEVLLATVTDREFRDEDVAPGSYHEYRVASVDASGIESRAGGLRWIRVPGAPLRPFGTEAEARPDSVRLTWHKPSSNGSAITGYRIYRGPDAANLTLLATQAADSPTAFDDRTGVPGVVYAYAVSAVNGMGEGRRSSEVHAASGAPTAPLNLNATAGDRWVLLSWDAPSAPGASPITHYEVGRSSDEVPWEDVYSTEGTIFEDDGLENGVTYTYRVRAVSAIGASDWSENVTATPAVQVAPQNLHGIPLPGGRVALAWEPLTGTYDLVEAYAVYRSLDGLEWTHVGDTRGVPTVFTRDRIGVPSFVDEGLELGTTYHYRVTGVFGTFTGDTRYESPPSEPIAVKTHPV